MPQSIERTMARGSTLMAMAALDLPNGTIDKAEGVIDAHLLMAATIYARRHGIPYSQEAITQLAEAAGNAMDMWRETHDGRN